MFFPKHAKRNSLIKICISSGYYRTSRHEYRLNFQPRTTVAECTSDKIPVHGLMLSTFSEILQADPNYPYLVVVGKQKEIVKESKRTKMIVIKLEAEGKFLDADRMRIITTLKNTTQDGSYVVYATVDAVNNAGDWFYLACECAGLTWSSAVAPTIALMTDVTLGLSTGEKLSQHTFSVGEASSCVKNLIEAFGESKDKQLEQDVDAITDSTLSKRH
ncbi:hypothetical protein DM860_006263 [Cuscuta australis]|uniref:DUF223 domain-containing protein n=1 Tax=Cuscuta australis TaxID=267555 RepID=A0A328DP60_9ASTE|nr:hypothetical protein DM860_006263 [Cuscuta australis]